MQQVAIVKTGTVKQIMPLLRRFAAKLVVDVVPAALTSVVGGILVAHYQFGHPAPRPAAAAEQAAPASAEMVKLVRDEHSAIMDYLQAQIAAEKSRNAVADAADARAVAEAKASAAEAKAAAEVAAATPVVRPAPVTPKQAAVRKPVVAVAALPLHEPLVVAQAAPQPVAVQQPAPQPEQKSLLSRTLDFKDHVVGATLHAVSAIGGIPSWIASMGDHNDNADTTPSAPPAAPSAAGRSFTS